MKAWAALYSKGLPRAAACCSENAASRAELGRLAAWAFKAALILIIAAALSGCGLFGGSSYKKGLAVVKTARAYLGVPYKFGGLSPRSGFDCSGLTVYVYKRHGVKLPRNSAQQAKAGRPIRKAHLRPGDLVFFNNQGRGRVNHVGIYIGNNKFIHAPGRGKKVSIANLNNQYFRRSYHSARRVF